MANCSNCVHNGDEYNRMIYIHEVCEKGYCVLCMRGKECEDFKEGKYVPTPEELEDY